MHKTKDMKVYGYAKERLSFYESDADDDYWTCSGHIWVIYVMLGIFIETMMIETNITW